DAVRELLEQLERATRGPAERIARYSLACSKLSLSIEEERADDAAADLEQLRAVWKDKEPTRSELLFKNYEADVLRIQRRFEEAARSYRPALDAPNVASCMYDLVSSLASGLAVSLFELGRYEEAVRQAELATQFGARGDRLDELIGLRIQAQCHWALGHQREAQELFLRAEAAHF